MSKLVRFQILNAKIFSAIHMGSTSSQKDFAYNTIEARCPRADVLNIQMIGRCNLRGFRQFFSEVIHTTNIEETLNILTL